MNEEQKNVVEVALDHLFEMQTGLFCKYLMKSDEVYPITGKCELLTSIDWDEMSTISRRISVIKSLQNDVKSGKYST